MRRLPILIGALALATTAYAADDPIAARQALMDNNGAAIGSSWAKAVVASASAPIRMGSLLTWSPSLWFQAIMQGPAI